MTPVCFETRFMSALPRTLPHISSFTCLKAPAPRASFFLLAKPLLFTCE